MRDRDIPAGLVEDQRTAIRTSAYRGMRGGMELKVIGFIVLLSVAGFVWIQFRQGVVREQTRLFRYKDEKGQTAYTDNLEKVPASQREAALKDKALPDITTADYDTYLEAVSEKKQEQKGFWGSLKEMMRPEGSGTAKPEEPGAPGARKVGSQGQNSKDIENLASKGALGGLAEIPKVVNGSLSSLSQELGGAK